MTETDPDPRHTGEDAGEFASGFEAHRLQQVRMGLRLTPAERLRWLERTMEELSRVLGRAKKGRPLVEDRPER